jgi:hypothetical protein
METYRCSKSYASLEELILDGEVDAVGVNWWATDMLPEQLRHDSGHEGSHTFLTHEFVDALVTGRQPTVNVYEALAYAAPGIVAHRSALAGGTQMRIPSFDQTSGSRP